MQNTLKVSEPTFNFQVAKTIREKYEIDESFFSVTGNVVFANFYQVRVFTQKLNEKRDPNNHVSPGEVNGAGLLDEIYHIAIRNYVKKKFPNAFPSAINNISETLGEAKFEKLLLEFLKVFPPQKVYKKEQTLKEYLMDSTESVPNKEIIVEELLLLHFANRNPAFNKIKELFDENYLSTKGEYKNTIISLRDFFKNEDLRIGITNTDLFDFLSEPFLTHNDSIWDQLEYIKNKWGIFIDQKLLLKIQSSKDLFIESIRFNPQDGGGGNTPTIVPKYKGEQIDADHLVIGKSSFKYAEESTREYDEPEQFTKDINWMPNLVLLAKNIYVWLDQLSKKYKREIRTLDQIPTEELAQLRNWNINGLWLIGVWERSTASKRIKHLMGNIDAVASAYSLYDYKIAHDLGGEYAYNIFNERAKEYGIRLASDMVPNHTGIYSNWMIEKPDYFVQLDYPPFPNYRFTGENLSEHPDVEIRIEDQYYDMKDAAVVFERKDLRNGQTKYFYHGNDGTVMPWNDTAQLNLLKAEVREALIQKIFDVARKFSVIRFDAAMTLAKKHFSRLWYPEPGKGGDIPSRADHALTRRQFDEFFPKEFWREVVDRINDEMPETLLLAEAFWLMEGYFVRTLGMHRVYNSAFMNMMMNEENSKYRELITNTLEFEPEILKRYVNFMSNPDEETAIEQFGDGDKYFGVLVLMCTLPGLPMFAHGQIEGYTEKYGMEYQRAYYNEEPKQWLVERHEREIFPILKKRYVFSEVQNFWLYDFIDTNGNLNEDVFIYSNKFREEKSLVIFNNKYQSISGSFLNSRQKLNGNSSNTSSLHNTSISYNLGIKNSDFHFYILRDVTTGLEYFFNGTDVNNSGLFLNLHGYEFRVFLVFKEIFDPSGNSYKFYKDNFGNGIYNISRELDKIKLSKIHDSFLNLFSEDILLKYKNLLSPKKAAKKNITLFEETLLQSVSKLTKNISNEFTVPKKLNEFNSSFVKSVIYSIELINGIRTELKSGKSKSDAAIIRFLNEFSEDRYIVFLLFSLVNNLKDLFDKNEKIYETYISEIMLTRPIKMLLNNNYDESQKVSSQMLLLNLILQFEGNIKNLDLIPDELMKLRSGRKIYDYLLKENPKNLSEFAESELLKTFLEVNTYQEKTYYSKERLEEYIDFISIYVTLKFTKIEKPGKKTTKQKKVNLSLLKKMYVLNQFIKKQSDESKYLYDVLLEKLGL